MGNDVIPSSPIFIWQMLAGWSPKLAQFEGPRSGASHRPTCQAWRNGNKGSSASATHDFDRHVTSAVDVKFFGGVWERSGTLRKWFFARKAGGNGMKMSCWSFVLVKKNMKFEGLSYRYVYTDLINLTIVIVIKYTGSSIWEDAIGILIQQWLF